MLFHLIVLLGLALIGNCSDKECDTKISSNDTHKGGTLKSQEEQTYPDNIRCFYYLVGLPDERVEVEFKKFDVTGVPPRCVHDYVDIYIQLKSVNESLLWAPLLGRFCGKDKDSLPLLIRSMSNIFLIALYTDGSKYGEGFELKYRFIPDDVYKVGEQDHQHLCGSKINNLNNGTILSPTYPGVYPDNITCFYKFHGDPGERIKLNFTDIVMYSGGKHCPFDYIKVFDGPTNEAPVIDTICGSPPLPLVIFSTNHDLLVHFFTKTGKNQQEETNTEQKTKLRGFNATFEIGKQFVKLDNETAGMHLAGTECDRLILSEGEGNGTITSPYYPGVYPRDITCHFFLDGLINKQNLENVRITINELNIGTFNYNAPQGKNCTSGFLHVFYSRNSIAALLDGTGPNGVAAPDEEFCGSANASIPSIVSDNPRLLLVFDTHNATEGNGFNASFEFHTDLAIVGTPKNVDAKCHFEYKSDSAVHGKFNSPRYPSYYPNGSYCVYEFVGRSDEKVRITFENFEVEYHPDCTKDYVHIFKFVPTSQVKVQVGSYCGSMHPGPQDEDSQGMKVILHSDNEGVGKGFIAKYEFIKKQPLSEKCFENISKPSGVVVSPNYPHKYTTNKTCEWVITARTKSSRILMTFDFFVMEGNPLEKQGCGNAVLKIYETRGGMPTKELCGDNKTYESLTVISEMNVLRLKFVTSAKATGAKGFRLPWMEVLPLKGDRCGGFRCEKNRHCIPNSLKCNNENDCGKGDDSDETKECGIRYTEGGALKVIITVVVLLVLLILAAAGAWWCFKRKKRREKIMMEMKYRTKQPPNQKVTSDAQRRPEKTEKVSIV